MLMSSKDNNQRIWSLTRLAIVGFSLASLNLATTSIISAQSAVAQTKHELAKASAELPVVKSAALGTNMDVPWSKPVKIEDPFEGNYVGIFDRNYFWSNFVNNNARVVVISLWSRNSIRVLLGYSTRNCAYRSYYHALLAAPECLISNNTLKISNLYIKIGEQVFRLAGNNGTFKVTDELATALKKSPVQNVTIRLLSESGESVDSQIGKRTVEAWKAVY